MKKETLTRLCRIYSIILAIFCVAAGVCLIFGCLSVYNTGEYSRAAVANAFAKIAIPVYAFVLLAVAGAFLPITEKRAKNDNSQAVFLMLYEKKNFDACDEGLKNAVVAQRQKRKKASLICAAVCTVSAVVFLAYALNASHFQADINTSVINAVCVLLPCLALAFATGLAVSLFNKKSIAREVALLKTAPNAEGNAKNAEKPCNNSQNTVKLVRAVLVLAAAVLTVYGYFTGGFEDVLTKAVNICTECIGLG